MKVDVPQSLELSNVERCRPARRQFPSAIACVLVALWITGCSPTQGDARIPISGSVTLDGKPLDAGYVIFEPKSGQTSQSGGMIQNGKFDVPRESGALPGLYSVAVFSGAEGLDPSVQPGTPEAEFAARKTRGELVPRKYNIDSILTAEVKPGEKNEFQFDLSTKK